MYLNLHKGTLKFIIMTLILMLTQAINHSLHTCTIVKCNHTQVKTHSHIKTMRQTIKLVPPPGVCPACQEFLENTFHFSMDEGHSAATPDLWGDCRLSPTVHKLKCQLSGFLSQDNKDLPTVSDFPAFFEQTFQMNHLIKHKGNILYEIIKYILRKTLTWISN